MRARVPSAPPQLFCVESTRTVSADDDADAGRGHSQSDASSQTGSEPGAAGAIRVSIMAPGEAAAAGRGQRGARRRRRRRPASQHPFPPPPRNPLGLPRQTRKQTVWRSFGDFRALHDALQRETGKSFDLALPRQQWCVLHAAPPAASLVPAAELRPPPSHAAPRLPAADTKRGASAPRPAHLHPCRYEKFTCNFKDAAEFRRCLLDDYLKVRPPTPHPI
jgi:hypothetical protein